jgi:hypothetical protein
VITNHATLRAVRAKWLGTHRDPVPFDHAARMVELAGSISDIRLWLTPPDYVLCKPAPPQPGDWEIRDINSDIVMTFDLTEHMSTNTADVTILP